MTARSPAPCCATCSQFPAAGFDVVAEACNGREAVRLAALHHPDLITMDLEMPEMTGIEAITEIMGTRPVPILVVSSFADAQKRFCRAVSCGAIDVVAKPDMGEEAVTRFLDKARMVASIRVITHMRGLRSPFLPVTATPLAASPVPAADLPVFAIASSIAAAALRGFSPAL